MQKHTKIYMAYFGYDASDFIPCELCGAKAVDIHHIDCRGMGGSEKDNIENLMALCRFDHIKYGDKKQFTDMLKDRHSEFMNKKNR